MSAGQPLAEEFSATEIEEGKSLNLSDAPLLALHMEFAEDQVCKLLLQIALMVRTYDDIMKDSRMGEAYKAHADQTNGVDYIGSLSISVGADQEEPSELNLRQACNKVIHAVEIRALYESIDRQFARDEHGKELDQALWYLTGEVELSGTDRGKPWRAVLFIQPFIEIVLERIAFEYPATDGTASS
ncbi:hypothetical protein HMI51_00555 [Corallococcus coralloides]|nr:hypothetical protein [Corallococcus coralloides]